ncbi:MAG: 4-hydroxy-tetrahydrodipicolinate synthase [Alphaproteobacteria bacterium]|nr:4-hydroxy-tetrahydrodipicolinate synthase [Alphaproteobacteria bacterium]
MFKGIYTAIITPFHKGKVDEKKLEELVVFQVNAGVQGIVPCGTTGESILLSPEEQKRVIEVCTDVCKRKIKVVPATGALTTTDTIFLTQQAQNIGADGVVIINPWYIKPSQESLYEYYKTINDNVDLPIIVYNNPTRTGVDTSSDTMIKLSACKNIQGYKDCSCCFQRVSELKSVLGNRYSLLSGNDDPFAAHLAMGGDGGILVASNVVPDIFVTLMKAWCEGDLPLFKATWKDVFPLLSALSLESNPAPIKYAMGLVHGVSGESRLPFVPLKPATRLAIEASLQNLGLLHEFASARER